MTIDPINLLRSLSTGSASQAQSKAMGASGPDAGGEINFAELLRQAQDGEISSKLPVTIDPDVEAGLSDEQLVKLSQAADRAEAAGVRTALVLVDGKRLVLDVHQRRVTGFADDSAGAGIVGGVDGVIDLSTQASETPRGMFGPLVLPGAERPAKTGGGAASALKRAENASVLKMLSELRKAE